MASSPANQVVDCLRTLAVHRHDDTTDGDLLDLYVRQRDEAAFEALVRRHGPMVLGVCRRLVGNAHDAEDAFQATFLVLVRKAATVRPAGMVGNWLYGVAQRTALEARRAAARRRAKEARAAPRAATPEDPLADLRSLLDREVARLPERYRVALVLCDLEGTTRKEAARQLALPEGTVASRLGRARSILARRLTRRGVTLAGGVVASALAQESAPASLPPALVAGTVKAAAAYATGPVAAATLVSAPVLALTEGGMRTMLLSKFRIGALFLVAVGLAAAGAGGVSYLTRANGQPEVRGGRLAARADARSPEAVRPAQANDKDRGAAQAGRPAEDAAAGAASGSASVAPDELPGAGGPATRGKGGKVQDEIWRMAMSLRASKRLPSAVQWAMFDHDPVPAFKSRIKKLRWVYREQLRRAKDQAAKEEIRKGWMVVQWDSGFKEIPGDRVHLLTADHPYPLTSNGPDGKKWIATKVQMAGDKPVCWSVPVELKYGEEVKVTLTEKNALDLGAAIDTALREGASSPEEQRMEEWARKTWRIRLSLRVRGRAPSEVSYAFFDEDAVRAFKAAVKKWQSKNGSVSGEERRAVMAAAWDGVFKKVPGNHLYQLRSGGTQTVASNAPDGKKWIVTKAVQIKGKPVCWSFPVKVKTGEEIAVTLTEDKAVDLESAFASALRERGPAK
jgi:RNA polymerase sigma factor (sigma-70 family)